MTMTRNPKSNPAIRHHLGDDLLLAYAAGALPEALSLMVATHVSLCDDCRAQLEACEALGGVLVEETQTAEIGAHALGRALALLDDAPVIDVAPARPARDCAVLPAPLQNYVGGDVTAVRWRSIGMGVKQAILPTGPGATARLLFIPAGAAVPDHSHRGLELTMVLQGAFSDELDSFARGDVETADPSVHHTPTADPGADCICLAVTDAPLRFTGLIPRLVQPFLRI